MRDMLCLHTRVSQREPRANHTHCSRAVLHYTASKQNGITEDPSRSSWRLVGSSASVRLRLTAYQEGYHYFPTRAGG